MRGGRKGGRDNDTEREEEEGRWECRIDLSCKATAVGWRSDI